MCTFQNRTRLFSSFFCSFENAKRKPSHASLVFLNHGTVTPVPTIHHRHHQWPILKMSFQSIFLSIPIVLLVAQINHLPRCLRSQLIQLGQYFLNHHPLLGILVMVGNAGQHQFTSCKGLASWYRDSFCLLLGKGNEKSQATHHRKQDSGQHVPTPRNVMQLTNTKYNAGKRIKRLPRELQK